VVVACLGHGCWPIAAVVVMGYAVYERNGRDCGYGIPAVCDHPACDEKIDRGLAYLCGKDPGGDEFGCGLYFCSTHLALGIGKGAGFQCERCADDEDPFEPKPDIAEWVEWKLTDESWQQWRDENADKVSELKSKVRS
jgi:hypothetical protein